MNRIPETALDDACFDRLVDGEMPDLEYRTLIESFDERPAGWKRCALAFLEAQAWRQELGAVRLAEPTLRSARGNRRPIDWKPAAIRWAAVAASVLGAFCLGYSWTRPASEIPLSFDPMRADLRPSTLPPLSTSPPPVIGVEAADQLAADGIGKTNGRDTSQPLDEVELVAAAGDGDWQSTARLPVMSLDGQSGRGEPRDFWSTPQVVELLRQSGREVKHRQEMLPFVLPDGRPVLMPVEQVEVTPVRMPAY